jgi:hypothetical protein
VRRIAACALVLSVAAPAVATDVNVKVPAVSAGELRLAAHPQGQPAREPTDEVARLLRNALNSSNKYALTTWWDEYMDGIEPYRVAGERARTTNTINSEEVRRYTSVAYGLASALATGAYDPAVTGVDTVTATRKLVELVDYVTSMHTANLAGSVGWGQRVQTGMWASQIALAGWLLGPALPAPTQVFLGRMLAAEADYIASRPVHYLRDRDGRLITPGNSGAEELAWDGVALWTAVELLPYHEHRTDWTRAAYTRFVGAYARPSDVRSMTVVNGRTTSAWLAGSNAEQSGMVVNHYRINPDYTTDISLWGAPVSGMVADGVPASMLVGADWTYRALTSYSFPSPPFRAPGGTVYKPGSTTVYYPSGADWGQHREVVYGSLDVQTAALSPTPTVRAVARKWAVAHLRVVRRMQSRYRTGQIYGPQTEDHYQAREEHGTMLLGNAYLTWWLAANDRLKVDHAHPAAKVALR